MRHVELYFEASIVTPICRVLANVSSLGGNLKTKDCQAAARKSPQAVRRCVGKFSEEPGSARAVRVEYIPFLSKTPALGRVRSLGDCLRKLA
jgi:hypothetical protein